MNIGRYQSSAGRTRNKNSNELANYALGMVCEAGEVGDILKKHIFHGHELDMEVAMYWLLSQYKSQEKTEVTG